MTDNNTLNHPESEQDLDALETGKVRTDQPGQTTPEGEVVSPEPKEEEVAEPAEEAAPAADEDEEESADVAA